tara:strand:+ start:1606 stop:1797 length:192 start_codon:yes stop_codon:yes gene_type:complete
MSAIQIKRANYLRSALGFFDLASIQAKEGDLDSAAFFIIKALDQERRAAVTGPQVLQLIKPTS